jgi:hypothetical protein
MRNSLSVHLVQEFDSGGIATIPEQPRQNALQRAASLQEKLR